MKRILYIFIIGIMMMSGCKKNTTMSPARDSSILFETPNLKMEIVSTNLPALIWDMYFFNEMTGIGFTRDGNIYKTTDAGKSWDLKYTHTTPDQPLLHIMFADQHTGYITGGASGCAGEGCTPPGAIVLKTTDGGETWEPIFKSQGMVEFKGIAKNSKGVLFLIKKYFIAPAKSATEILKSNDGGINWTSAAKLNHEVVKLVFNDNYGFCTGGSGNAIITRSDDNGDTWSNSTSLPGYWTADIAFSGNTGYCIVDNHTVYKTTDNGNNWSQIYSSSEYSSIRATPLNENVCMLWGAGKTLEGDAGTSYGAVRQTLNGGSNWSEDIFGYGPIRITNFYSATEAYILSNVLVKVTAK